MQHTIRTHIKTFIQVAVIMLIVTMFAFPESKDPRMMMIGGVIGTGLNWFIWFYVIPLIGLKTLHRIYCFCCRPIRASSEVR